MRKGTRGIRNVWKEERKAGNDKIWKLIESIKNKQEDRTLYFET